MAETPTQVPNFYSDHFALAVGPYGAALTFSLTHPEMGGPEGPRVYPATTIRMSLEHLKVIAWIAHKQITAYQEQFGIKIPLPSKALESVHATPDEWRAFWGE